MTASLRRSALLTCLGVLCFSAGAAGPLTPDWLPPLDPLGHSAASPAAAPVFSWQLHQRLELQPAAGAASVSLDPSLTVQLADPRAQLLAEQTDLTAALSSMEEADLAARSALDVHGSFLRLQAAHWLLSVLHGLLELSGAERWADAEETGDLTGLQLQVLLADLADHAAYLSLQLELAGMPVAPETGLYFRPVTAFRTEPLAQCLSTSRELRRLELLASLQELSAGLSLAGRQPAVSLDLGLRLGLRLQSHGAEPQFGWNVGLRIARADHSGPQLRFDASGHSVVQTLTVRGPEADPLEHDQAADLARAADQAHLSLIAMVQASDQAFRSELLERELASQAARNVKQQLVHGAAAAEDVLELAQRLVTLAQAVVASDQLLLQLAVECRVPVSWREVVAYPWPD